MVEEAIGAASVMNFLIGSGVKLVTSGADKFFDHRRQKEMVMLRADRELLLQLQNGEDKADPFTRMTRRIIALALTGVFLYILFHLTVVSPTTQFHIPVSQEVSWFWRLLNPLPINEKGLMLVSGGSILWETWKGFWLVLGFYFTKIGK